MNKIISTFIKAGFVTASLMSAVALNAWWCDHCKKVHPEYNSVCPITRQPPPCYVANKAEYESIQSGIAQQKDITKQDLTEILEELSKIDPGQLDQGRLMPASITMTRRTLASELLTNFQQDISMSLKDVIQKVR
ncbi:MAG: hypothetical protein LBJ78_01685 [Puniceicoccales bacterium]|jgi:hypothetical protein|nr:hypothetical protein [Puniceicoccales bacterium]